MTDPKFDAFHADGDADPRLTLVCTDGTTVGCTNFTATEGGVLLTDDLERERVFGFVPNGEVRFVLPTETADRIRREEVDRGEFEDPLIRLPGVGSTYAGRLRDAGYESLDAVAGADPATLADATGANESRTTEWVERARRASDADGERGGTE